MASGEYFLKASPNKTKKWKQERLNKQKLSVRDKKKDRQLFIPPDVKPGMKFKEGSIETKINVVAIKERIKKAKNKKLGAFQAEKDKLKWKQMRRKRAKSYMQKPNPELEPNVTKLFF